MKAIIMAGGRGTRISSIAFNIPKPMIKIEGKPILEYGIICLREQGVTDLIITVSHLGSIIMNYFGTGEKFGVKIQYFNEEIPIGNAGALFKLKNELPDEFFLLNADVIFDVDINRFLEYHRKKGGLVTILTHPNSHPYDSAVLATDENGMVKKWFTREEKRPQWYQNCTNAGIHVMNLKVLDMVGIDSETVGTDIDGNIVKVDLDRQILKPLCGTGMLFAYNSSEYVKDMGTPERYEVVCRDFLAGQVNARNLKRKQKAIFLDRDGTINRYVGFLQNIDDFELLPGVAEAIRKINLLGYLAIVVTNQPVIARGMIDCRKLQLIHNKMETLLGQEGAYLDAIYFCPHHPHKGYKNEVPELKIECSCRKPKPGMLFRAAIDFNIDLSASWMIGDSQNDVTAGKAAGCKTILIGKERYGQDIAVNSLQEAVACLI